MPMLLDHLLVPAKDRFAAARLLATLLGVPWAEQAAIGPFSQVFVNDHFTIDFDSWPEPLPKLHYCFRVLEPEFDAILARIEAAQIPYRSTPHGPNDGRVNSAFGGRLLYWDQPDGHVWELLTVSYARRSSQERDPRGTSPAAGADGSALRPTQAPDGTSGHERIG